MNNFLENWNFKKHITAVSSFYLGAAVIGNALFGKKIPEDEKSMCPVEICKHMPKGQKVFDGILAGCYAVDLTVTYFVIRHFQKQYK